MNTFLDSSKREFRQRKFPLPLLTPLGLILLSGILPFSLLGLVLSLPLNASLVLVCLYIAALLAVVIVERAVLSIWLRELSISLSMPTCFFAGVEGEIDVQLRNPKSSSSLLLRMRLEVPKDVIPKEEFYTHQPTPGPLKVDLRYRMTPQARGPVQWTRSWMRVQRKFGLSLLQFELRFDPPFECVVYPNHQLADDDVAKPLQHLLPGETAIEVRRGEGREFESLRKYAVGDDLRKVDWKRSAKGRGLFVRVFRPETHQRVNVAIDCGRRMGNRVSQRHQLDFAVDAAACLFHMAAKNDDECGLLAFNQSIITKHVCKKGRSHFLNLRDALTALRTGSFESDYQLLAEWANSSRRRSLMLLITSVSSPASLDSIMRAFLPIRRRHLPLVFAVADEDLEDALRAPANNLTDSYIISAAKQQQAAIEDRAASLGRYGIECIYCRAPELPLRLRYKYQELKMSGRL